MSTEYLSGKQRFTFEIILLGFMSCSVMHKSKKKLNLPKYTNCYLYVMVQGDEYCTCLSIRIEILLFCFLGTFNLKSKYY